MTLAEALLPEWDREMGLSREVLARVPDGRLAWQPHARSRSMGQLVAHLAELPRWAVTTLDQAATDITLSDPPPAESTQAVLARFDANTAAGRALLVGKTDAELQAPWTLHSGGHELATMPRIVALRNFVLNHQVHHRGQLCVYLRLCDVPLPSLYGPSADVQPAP